MSHFDDFIFQGRWQARSIITENKALVYLPYNFINGKKAIRGPLNSEHSQCPLKRSQTFDFPFSNSQDSMQLLEVWITCERWKSGNSLSVRTKLLARFVGLSCSQRGLLLTAAKFCKRSYRGKITQKFILYFLCFDGIFKHEFNHSEMTAASRITLLKQEHCKLGLLRKPFAHNFSGFCIFKD